MTAKASSSPRLERSEAIQIATTCMIALHIWSMLNIFYRLPALSLSLNNSEILQLVAGVQVFALLESGLLFLVAAGAAYLLPRRWLTKLSGLDNHTKGILISMLLIILAGWAVYTQYHPGMLGTIRKLAQLGLGGLVSLAAGIALLRFFPRLGQWMRLLLERLWSLALFYLILDGLAVLVALVSLVVNAL